MTSRRRLHLSCTGRRLALLPPDLTRVLRLGRRSVRRGLVVERLAQQDPLVRAASGPSPEPSSIQQQRLPRVPVVGVVRRELEVPRHLPGARPQRQLVVVELPPRNEAHLPDGPRIVQHVDEGRRGVATRPQLDGRRDPPRRRRAEPEVHTRALDIQTGRTVWSYAQSGEARTFSGVLSTDGDVVFFGENGRIPDFPEQCSV